MTGSAADAEDLVQDAYLRWTRRAGVPSADARSDGGDVRSPRDYLVATVTRLAVDHLRSARVRREAYVGPWLPEPLPTAPPVGGADVRPEAADPGAAAELADSLRTAFLVVLEALAPEERAALLLHDVFGYGYADLAHILAKSEPACRQLVSRARRHVAARRPRFDAPAAEVARVTERFVAACATGDVPALLALLAPDVTYIGDGGGRVPSARRPIAGADAVARLLVGLAAKAPPDMEARVAPVNGQPGIVLVIGGRPSMVLTLSVAGGRGEAGRGHAGRVHAVYAVSNPDKLRRLTAAPRSAPRSAAPCTRPTTRPTQ